jgi:mannose-1-phosphate guanylyltransferase
MTTASPNTARAQQVRVLFLAGGLGTRLKPLTDTVPKCLILIAGRPLLDYWLGLFGEAGLRDIRINTHHLAEAVRVYIEHVNSEGHFHISEAYERSLLGSAGTVTANRNHADGAKLVLIVYADNLSDVDLNEMITFHESHGDPMTMMLFRAPRPENCGIVELDEDKRVLSFVEKPKEPKSDLANAGLYILNADAYREVADMKAFDFGFDVLPRFVGRMRGWLWPGYHLDIGTHEALARAEGDVKTLRKGAHQGRQISQ